MIALAYIVAILSVVMIGMLVRGMMVKGYENLEESIKVASVPVMLGILVFGPILSVLVIRG